MRQIQIIYIVILLCFSCKQETKNLDIDYVVNQYIHEFKYRADMKKRNLLVKIKIDSSLNDFVGYRIYTSGQLLFDDELPNRIDERNGMKVAFFTKELMDKKDIALQKIELENKSFYNKDSFLIDSNYPEWVVIKSKNSNEFKVLKNTHYQDLSKIYESEYKN